MSNNNALELLNMFTKAARIAQANNIHSVKEELDNAMLKKFLKEAFPHLKQDIDLIVFLKKFDKVKSCTIVNISHTNIDKRL